MAKTSAKIIEYQDFDKNEIVKCPVCHWKGVAKDNIEYFEQLLDVTCPKCDKIILIVNYPKGSG